MQVDFVCRKATTEDALCLSVLASQVFLDTYATSGINADLANEVTTVLSKEAFLKRIASRHVEIWIATQESNLVGFLDLDFSSACPDPAVTGMEILRLYVQQPFQRRNVGRTLMALAEERACKKGKESLWLTAWVGNLKARDFYKVLGYRDVGDTQYVIEGKAYENRILVKDLSAKHQ